MKNKKIWERKEIREMFDGILSEEHYDIDDISTIICNRIIDRDKMFSNEEYYRFIYDIFCVCYEYKNELNDEHDFMNRHTRVQINKSKEIK